MKLKLLNNIGVFLTLCLFYSHAYSSPFYEEAKRDAITARNQFMLRYESELTLLQEQNLLNEINLTFQQLLTEKLAPAWYGTKWAFHGTSQKPGQGAIACGYFVTTLVSKDSIRRFSNKPLTPFLSNLSDWGYGVYVVGLDFHVGFISVEPGGIYFIHSSYQSPYAVTRDIASESSILSSSKYRVVGKLEDKKFITGWLNQAKFETVGK